MRLVLGFTGTRKGMSESQMGQLRTLLLSLEPPAEFHHGAAVGADTQAAAMAAGHGWRPVDYPALGDPLGRNKLIVEAADLLIAAPETDREQVRSGTWATVRLARRRGIAVVMLSRGPGEDGRK